jgi:hypothetical protein
MSEYIKQAKDFLANTGTKCSISFVRYGRHFDEDKECRNIYRVRLSRNGKSYSFLFGDSIANGWDNKRPSVYCVLACLTKYEPEADVWDFAKEFGYEIASKQEYNRTAKIHKAVIKEYAGVERLFDDVMEELREIQ